VEFISTFIFEANKSASVGSKHPLVEAESIAVEDWSKIYDELSANSLFRKTNSWILGANVARKKPSVLFYFGGLKNYRGVLEKVVRSGNKGFKPFGELHVFN
jgi:cyclohexanone monooxygenase